MQKEVWVIICFWARTANLPLHKANSLPFSEKLVLMLAKGRDTCRQAGPQNRTMIWKV